MAVAAAGTLALAGCTPAAAQPRPAGAARTHPSPSAPSASPSVSASPTPKPADGAPVHASIFEGDGATYGVGMPIILRFSRPVRDPHAIQRAIHISSVPPSMAGAWYWFTPTEAHYRPPFYWAAHATITMDAPIKGISAGPGLVIDDNLTLVMHTGAAHVSTINSSTLRMTVTSDGRPIRVIPVSLGKAGHRTFFGVKVVEAKTNPERMISDPPTGPGSYNVLVPWSVRVTNSGEFVHAAPWNPLVGQSNQSHGCTNLNTADAKWFYSFSGVGDVVVTTQSAGMSRMRSWDGWGDWNVPWSVWSAGKA